MQMNVGVMNSATNMCGTTLLAHVPMCVAYLATHTATDEQNEQDHDTPNIKHATKRSHTVRVLP